MAFKPFVPYPEPEASPTDPAAPRGNPRVLTPNDDPRLHGLEQPESLIDSFGDLVDDLRQIAVDFGARPYRMWSVITRWTGGQKGRGEQEVIRETEIVPTPVVTLDLRAEAKPGGMNEKGTLLVSEISPRYTEDDLRALFCLQPLPEGHEGFIELRMDARDGRSTRRRFVVQGAPERRADMFDWRVRLREQDVRRDRDGNLQRTTLR